MAEDGVEWWSEETVAVVTGANRGIGLEVCRQLTDKGSPSSSVMDFIDWLKQHVGFVDILGHLLWANRTSDRYKSARGCQETNFFGTKRLTKAFFPLLRPSSHKPRIVNVSSGNGLLGLKPLEILLQATTEDFHCNAKHPTMVSKTGLAISSKSVQTYVMPLVNACLSLYHAVDARSLGRGELMRISATLLTCENRRLPSLVQPEPFPTLGDKPTDEERKAYESFTSDDLMAKTTMLAFMEDDQIRVFEDCPTAKEMFDTITSKYNTVTTTHVQLLQEQYNSYRMKESDDVMDHANKMLVMAKDLAVMGNVISDNMQISTILNSLPPSWDMAVTALSVQFDNLTLEKFPLQLALQQRLTKRNRAKLMIVQEKPVGSHVSVKPKQFKNRNDGKFKGNFAGTKKSQGTVVKCYRCGKAGHIRKNCRTTFTNMKDNKGQGNYNRRKPQDDSDRGVICVVSECLFADGDLTG
ncbi:hypothetical protein EJ110_NYTH22418 [Nymphaea thermarum]|nr:hypothetical protein EJ110_NYTH22418 [Nymphaea thermarum]